MKKQPPREGTRDEGHDDPRYTFKLPRTSFPEPVMRGVRGWKTGEGWAVLRLHYSADPERATPEWIADQLQGYRGGIEGRDWRREMEIDFSAYAGEPVYAGFDPEDSVRQTPYRPDLPLWRGWDFGYRHPAVVWTQLWPATAEAPNGTLVVLHELYPTLDKEAVPGIKTADLADLVLAETARKFPETQKMVDNGSGVLGIVQDFADPSGNQTKETSDFSSIEILQQYDIHPEWSRVGRKNRIDYLRRYIEEPAAFRIDPSCPLLIKALSAAYRYPEERAGGADRDMPDIGKKVQEEPYVHLADALEYIAACNLEIPWKDTPRGTVTGRGKIAELLASSRLDPNRRGVSVAQALESELEEGLADLIGVDGDVTEAWLRY